MIGGTLRHVKGLFNKEDFTLGLFSGIVIGGKWSATASNDFKRFFLNGKLANRNIPIPKDMNWIDFNYDSNISRFHTYIFSFRGYAFVMDLESNNGTWVNRERLSPWQPVKLKNGDEILVQGEKDYIFKYKQHNVKL